MTLWGPETSVLGEAWRIAVTALLRRENESTLVIVLLNLRLARRIWWWRMPVIGIEVSNDQIAQLSRFKIDFHFLYDIAIETYIGDGVCTVFTAFHCDVTMIWLTTKLRESGNVKVVRGWRAFGYWTMALYSNVSPLQRGLWSRSIFSGAGSCTWNSTGAGTAARASCLKNSSRSGIFPKMLYVTITIGWIHIMLRQPFTKLRIVASLRPAFLTNHVPWDLAAVQSHCSYIAALEC